MGAGVVPPGSSLPTGIVLGDPNHLLHHNTTHGMLQGVNDPFALAGITSAPLSALPAAGIVGRQFYEETFGRLLTDTGLTWRTADESTRFNVADPGFGGVPGAADNTAAIAAAHAAAGIAGGTVTITPGLWIFDTQTLLDTNTNPRVNWEFVGDPVLKPLNADKPLFQGPISGNADFVRFIGRFTVQPHASGSTGPAILLRSNRWCTWDFVSYESPGANDYENLFDLVSSPGGCYGNRIEHVEVLNCNAPNMHSLVHCTNADGGGAGSNPATNPNVNYVGYIKVIASTMDYLVDAADSTLFIIESGHWEQNTVTACLIPGSLTYLGKVWIELNNPFEVHASGADSVNANNVVLDHNYYSGAQTLTIPVSIDNWEIHGPLTGLVVTDNSNRAVQKEGGIVRTFGNNGQIQWLSDHAGANDWFWINCGTTGLTPGALILEDVTHGNIPLMMVGGASPQIGFLGSSGSARVTLNAACTDLATAIALTNQLRALAIAFGLGV